VGLRYRGTAFNAVVFGFPIYFLQEDDAQGLAQDLFRELRYR
jgi:hypothetical protein